MNLAWLGIDGDWFMPEIRLVVRARHGLFLHTDTKLWAHCTLRLKDVPGRIRLAGAGVWLQANLQGMSACLQVGGRTTRTGPGTLSKSGTSTGMHRRYLLGTERLGEGK